jgi:hypothetical protein
MAMALSDILYNSRNSCWWLSCPLRQYGGEILFMAANQLKVYFLELFLTIRLQEKKEVLIFAVGNID